LRRCAEKAVEEASREEVSPQERRRRETRGKLLQTFFYNFYT